MQWWKWNLLFVLLSHLTPSDGMLSENWLDLFHLKRRIRGLSEDDIIADVEKYVATIPSERYAGDYYLTQYFDYINEITSFHHIDPLRQEYALYSIGFDKDTTPTKDIFVLKKNEDHLKIIKTKRAYVVIRRVSKDTKYFYISYLYLKDPNEFTDPSTLVEVNGVKFEIELDIWDHRDGKEYKSQIFGQTSCKPTIFVPCKSMETSNFPPTSADLKKKEQPEKLNFAAGKISLPNGHDADEYIDYFDDLDDDTTLSRYVGLKVENLTRTGLRQLGRKVGGGAPGNAGNENAKRGGGIFGSFIKAGMNIANSFASIGLGLAKNFGGMFGGLGTKQATLTSVAASVDIKGEDGAVRWLEDNEMADILAEVQQESSGGLGGMINAGENKEKPNEVNDDQFAAGRGLLDFLPENFKDPMPDEVVEEVVTAALHDDIDSFSHPGWKTLGIKVASNSTLAKENQPFIGFGACGLQVITLAQMKDTKSPEKLVELLLLALGTFCIKEESAMISELFADGYVASNKQNHFEIPAGLKLLKNAKLNTDETLRLLKAFELGVFSEVYQREVSNPSTSLTAPDGSKLSRSVFTFGNYVKTAITTLRKSAVKIHCVKIKRSLVKTLKSFFVKLLEDKIILQNCGKCPDKQINYNDSVFVMGLMQFVFRGLTTPFRDEEIGKVFDAFYKLNKGVFEGKVRSYYI